MGELNLDDIRARAELVSATRQRWANEVGIRDLDVLAGLRRAKQLAVEDVPALLAEVERLRSNVERTREWVRVADAEDVTDWQRGYRACSDRALRALAGESGE